MARDYRKSRAFQTADKLVKRVYKEIEFTTDERFGLQSQIRRAAVSVPVNIVEGSQRRTQKDYAHFLYISMGSAAEVAYLLKLCADLDMPGADKAGSLSEEYSMLVKNIQAFISKIERDLNK